ncbi:MAG: hypothetical protein WC504_01590 [Methylobacter sp.]
MSAIKLTFDEVNKTCRFIISDSRRKFKQALANYHDSSSPFYRDMEHCRSELNLIDNTGSERLQGLIFLFLGNEQLITGFKTCQGEITEDRKLFGSLLIAGGHYKDEILVDLKEVA